MATITYGGVKYEQVRHAAYCRKCNQTVESLHVHDYKLCMCGSVGVDGGISPGNRFIGRPDDIDIRDVYCAFVNGKTIWLPLSEYPDVKIEISWQMYKCTNDPL